MRRSSTRRGCSAHSWWLPRSSVSGGAAPPQRRLVQLPTMEKSSSSLSGSRQSQTLDPCCANFIRSHEALLLLYDVPVIHPAVEQDGALVADATQLEGRYFESWEAHDDGLTYTIKVRVGVTFADGTPVTAETVRYMIDRNLNTPGGGAWLLTNIAFVWSRRQSSTSTRSS